MANLLKYKTFRVTQVMPTCGRIDHNTGLVEARC